MKKNIVFYFEYSWEKAKLDTPFEWCWDNIEKRQSYLIEELISDNTEIYLVRHEENHIEENYFIPEYIFENWDWIHIKAEKIYAHLCLGYKISKTVTNIFPSLNEYMRDKRVTEELFPQYSIASIECQDYNDIVRNFSRVQTTHKVLKPYNGSQWKWVFITESIPQKNEFDSSLFPYLLQEFIDTSDWFWWHNWYYDLRIIILSWRIIWKILRQPKKWKHIANVAQEWILIDLESYELPTKIEKIIDEVDRYFQKISKHRYYSIDFWIDKSWVVKIFEMNSYPGLGIPRVAKELWKYIMKNMI